uniref:Uncharacterized protein n=1 Tax=Arundo donax TaxID=35708 RepID=A0A0A8YBA8_ARUDO
MSLSMGMMTLEKTMKFSAELGRTGGPVYFARHFRDLQEAVEEKEQGKEEVVEGGAAIRLTWKTLISRFLHNLLN